CVVCGLRSPSVSQVFANCWRGSTARAGIPLHTNGSERDLRCQVMVGSLCSPSLTVGKHWECVLSGDATRASVSANRGFDRRRGEVDGPDLVRRATHNLHGWQNACRNQLSYQVAADPQRLRCLAQGEPFATLFC